MKNSLYLSMTIKVFNDPCCCFCPCSFSTRSTCPCSFVKLTVLQFYFSRSQLHSILCVFTDVLSSWNYFLSLFQLINFYLSSVTLLANRCIISHTLNKNAWYCAKEKKREALKSMYHVLYFITLHSYSGHKIILVEIIYWYFIYTCPDQHFICIISFNL